ncbi:hypothetical protein [Halocola ammonii]
MRLFATTLSLMLISFMSFSQNELLNYSWQEDPNYDSLIADVADLEVATILDKRIVDMVYEGSEQGLTEYFLMHQMIYVNSESSIEENNKVYLNLNQSTELVDYDARVITPAEVKVLGEDALKKGTTEEGDTYKYFAMEGAEKGSIIEFYYIMNRYPRLTGIYLPFQSDYHVVKNEFGIYSPENLIIATKSLNGYPELEKDTAISDYNALEVEMSNIPALSDEEFANIQGNRMGVLYHLKENYATGNSNVYNYGDVSQRIFESLNPEISNRQQRKLEKILKNAQVAISLGKRDEILKIENYVKTNFAIVEAGAPELSDLDFILENNVCNETGATMLLYQLYKMADISPEIVLTCSRYDVRFYKDFESYVYLDTYLLYFPEIDEYLIPSGTLYRLGLLPFGYIHNNGLFIKSVEVGGMRSGLGRVKFIPAPPADHSQQNMKIDVAFAEDMSKLEIDYDQELTGYYAFNFQPYFTFMESESDKDDLKEGIAKSINENIEIKEVKTRNEGVDKLMKKPFIVNCSFSSADYLENAGDKTLFKIGQLIGEQAELYQDEERINPVENTYNHMYSREITFTLPEGYVCKNLDDLNLSVTPFKDGNDGAGFTSTYSVDGNKVTVTVDEYYTQMEFPVEEYQPYREVINAAADFNKITLVLEKS